MEHGRPQALIGMGHDHERRRTPDAHPRRGEKHVVAPPFSPHSVPILGLRRETWVRGGRDRQIIAVAERQRGCISSAQLAALEVSDDVRRRLERKGWLQRRFRGVYGVGPLMPLPFTAEAAALLAVPTAVAAAGRSAARMWGIPIPSSGDARPEVTITGDHGTRIRAINAHRAGAGLAARDIRQRHGVPVTSAARTLLDLAAVLGAFDLQRAVDETFVANKVTDGHLTDVLRRNPHHRGAAALRNLLAQEAEPALTRSAGERRMRRLMKAAGLPQPLSNVKMHGFKVDFYWPDHGLVVELDGEPFHSRRGAFERDHRKDQVLRRHGLQPLRITGAQLKHEPIAVAVLVAQALAVVQRRAG